MPVTVEEVSFTFYQVSNVLKKKIVVGQGPPS